MTCTEINAEFDRYVNNSIPIRLVECDVNGDLKLVGRQAIKDHFQPLISRLALNEEQFVQTRTRRQRQLAVSDLVQETIKYAVLSHRWSAEEVALQDFGQDTPRQSIGWRKIIALCQEVARQGIRFAWVDTCCIDKTSSVELDESIRSMFRWYRNATVCVVHLAQTTSIMDMARDEWFRRGWTLQELLAPRSIQFFDRDWQRLSQAANYPNDKEINSELLRVAYTATGIYTWEMCDFKPSPTDVDRRMSWASNRQVTREEDMAYSLMGIFDVSIATAYGEGADRAFCRLVEAIMMTGGDASVLDWGGMAAVHHATQCFPASPRSYIHSYHYGTGNSNKLDMALTSKGLRVPLVLFRLTLKSGDRSQGIMRFTFEAYNISHVVKEFVITTQDYNTFDRRMSKIYGLGVTCYKTSSKPSIASPLRGFLLEGEFEDFPDDSRRMSETRGKVWRRIETDLINIPFTSFAVTDPNGGASFYDIHGNLIFDEGMIETVYL